MGKAVMVVAGEPSGDLYASHIVWETRALSPDTRFFGIGGPRMREAGVDTLVDAADMAVVGVVEVVAHAGVILRAFRRMTRILDTDPPDLLIIVDYPDFNLLLAARAKKRGVKVLFFISPSVWAWRSGRAKKIARLVDHMAVIFPFEVPYYEREGVPVTFVGHPLLDTVPETVDREAARTSLGLDPQRRTVGLFPGSRRGEIRSLFSEIVEAARLLQQDFPDLQFVLPLAPGVSRAELEPALREAGVPVVFTEGRIYDTIGACDAAITVSGTVTMEVALLGVPMVIVYRVSPSTYLLGRMLIKVQHIGICNIIAGERVVPELLQQEACGETIARETARYLADPAHAAQVREKLSAVRLRLGEPGCFRRMGVIVRRLLEAP